MSEESTIQMSSTPITIDRLKSDLFRIGVCEGDLLLVHSSLSSLGWVCGGAQSVIMALLSVLGPQGTLVMPSHSGDWSDPTNWSNPPVPNHWISIIKESMPAYDKNLTCTRKMGKISELFRLQPGVIRSEQPQLSFSAIGPLAKTIINGEQTFPQLGMNSPLGKCYELKAKVLLMGVDYDSNTCFHLAETLIPMMKSELCGSPILINGKRTWHEFIDFDYDSSDFLLCGENFEMTDRVSINDIGCGRSKLFSIIDAVDFAKKWLLINRKF